ncbi:LOW QUALITY PROTEIN: hypothetical protein Cgig2_013258 [Carnegiea gigantea]|uniref:Uncharacterized protein n=1 Tax=Carnegiea gigantea TaxID=171969 RepID=A0A9Q1K2E6_9CARY|nr:LOW QUALITY PROTEIN: hypothetical protein Cgig2_013258 [Carnegiea gigantea]
MSWTRESLTPGSALMKLAEGRGVSEEAPLTIGVTAPAALEGGSVPRTIDSPIGERPAGRPLRPPPARGRRPDLARLSLSPLLLADRQTHSGPLPVGTREGACKKEFSLYAPRETKGGKANKVVYHTFLACWVTRSCLSSCRLRSRPPLVQEWHPQSRRPLAEPSLDLHKTNRKSGQHQTQNKLVLGRLRTLGEVLKDQKADRGEKEVERRPNLIPGYFQYFSFDFFSMAVMKPDLLLKQYHPKSPVSLGALWTVRTRPNARLEQNLPNYRMQGKTETVVEGCPIYRYTLGGRLIHGTEPPSPNDDSGEELVETPSEDELLEEAKNAGGEGILADRPRGSARLKKGSDIGNLFRLPILILSGDFSHHPAINKGREVGELRVPTLNLEAILPLSCAPRITSSMICIQTSKVDHLKPTSDDYILLAIHVELKRFVQQHGIERCLKYLRELKLSGCSQRKARAQHVEVLGKRARRTRGAPPAPDEGLPDVVSHLSHIADRRKCHTYSAGKN